MAHAGRRRRKPTANSIAAAATTTGHMQQQATGIFRNTALADTTLYVAYGFRKAFRLANVKHDTEIGVIAELVGQQLSLPLSAIQLQVDNTVLPDHSATVEEALNRRIHVEMVRRQPCAVQRQSRCAHEATHAYTYTCVHAPPPTVRRVLCFLAGVQAR